MKMYFYKWGFWIRLKKYSLSIAKCPPLFSERYGYTKAFRIGKWRAIIRKE